MDKWIQKLIAALEKWFNKKYDPKPEPPKPDDPVTPPQDGNDAIPISSISWLGDNYSSAKATAVLMASHLSSSQHTISDAAPSNWPKITVKVEVQGIICLFYERDGKVVGGKYDYLRPNQKAKGLENLRDGYHGHSLPSKGSSVWTCFVSLDEKQRSNIVKVVWK